MADLRADELNNRALSLLDLGRKEAAERVLAEALTLDPRHPQAVYNAGLLRWRDGSLSDEGLLAEIEAVRQDLPDPKEADQLTALVHLERGDLAAADSILRSRAEDVRDEPDSRQALTALGSGQAADARCVGLWQVPWRRSFPDWITPSCSIDITGDLRLALTSAGDRTVQLWDVRAGRALDLLDRARALPGSERAPEILTAVRSLGDRTVRTGVRAAWPARSVRTGPEGVRIRAVGLSSGARLGAWAGFDGPIQLWNLGAGRAERAIDTGHHSVSVVRFSPDGHRLVSLGHAGDGFLQTWSVDTGERLGTLRFRGLTRAALSPDCRFAFVVEESAMTMSLWDLAEHRELQRLAAPERKITTVSLSADGRQALTCGDEKVIRLWDLPSGRCARAIQAPSLTWDTATLSPDGSFVLSVETYRDSAMPDARGPESVLGRLHVWDAATGGRLRTFEAQSRHAGRLTLSADGRFALTSGTESEVRLWELATGRCLRTLSGHMRTVPALAPTPDLNSVLTADNDGVIRLWELDWDLRAREEQ